MNLRFIINMRSVYHAFGVVKNLPICMLIGGEFLRPHEYQIIDNASDRDPFGRIDV